MSKYIIKMSSESVTAQASIPKEFLDNGIDGVIEYAKKLQEFYPRTKFTVWEVTEKLIEF